MKRFKLFGKPICGVIYRQHNSLERFQNYFEETIENLSSSGKYLLNQRYKY